MASEVSCPPKEETRISSTKIIADSVVAEYIKFQILFGNSADTFSCFIVIDMTETLYTNI